MEPRFRPGLSYAIATASRADLSIRPDSESRVVRAIIHLKRAGASNISVSIDERIATLRLRHQELDRIIEEEQRRLLPEEPLIKNLKRRKLRIKDKIAAIEVSSGQPDFVGAADRSRI